MNLKEKIANLSNKYFQQVTEIRHYLHKHPELSFHEVETSKYISEVLKSIGIKHKCGIAKTGITGVIEGRNPQKKCIALRADMDALPIEEKNDFPFKSVHSGVMHACGHDAHSASLLGTLMILNELKDEFEGTVKFIFQPAEEKLPGGAKAMIEEGVLENPTPDLIIAQHVYPELESGKLGFKAGTYMASSDEIYITVKGKGGHAAIPDKIDNTVLIASKLIVDMQQISKVLAPTNTPTVLSFGKVIANGATNVIPDEVKIEGTFRTMNEKWRDEAHIKIKEIASEMAKNHNITIDVTILKGYPVLINHESSTNKAILFAENLLGKENIVHLESRMTSEDFAYYSQKIPSVFYRLGISEKGAKTFYPLHSPNFTLVDYSLKTGISAMAYLTIQFLEN